MSCALLDHNVVHWGIREIVSLHHVHSTIVSRLELSMKKLSTIKVFQWRCKNHQMKNCPCLLIHVNQSRVHQGCIVSKRRGSVSLVRVHSSLVRTFHKTGTLVNQIRVHLGWIVEKVSSSAFAHHVHSSNARRNLPGYLMLVNQTRVQGIKFAFEVPRTVSRLHVHNIIVPMLLLCLIPVSRIRVQREQDVTTFQSSASEPHVLSMGVLLICTELIQKFDQQ